ncbi:MAG TPA: aminotransferase class I/II-fold pyridoxal phosphate-dependent enzyme [Caulobacteraceae bacterium]|nr:aminotransferase class I/II-fold pyridoxal phosphate-dependent enzyme [Caulobacteraceae bacterium]
MSLALAASSGVKQHIEDLAIFGGRPLFDRPRPVGQLDAPPVDRYLELLRESFEARHLTNDGPLALRLEAVLAERHEVRHCVSLANAALGLTMLMQLFARGRSGRVAMPAFSYRGLPHFARWAGQKPLFCDVDRETHTLDPAALDARIDAETHSILAVCTFNSPGDLDGLADVAARRGIPLFLDSVYGLETTYGGRVLGGFGRAEVYSTHATKLLNGFEGGYITTNDDDLAAVLRWQRNFALPGQRPDCAVGWDHTLGLNAKLTELHAAMALASLEGLSAVVERNQTRHEAYRHQIEPIDGLSLIPAGDPGERRNFQLAVLDVQPAWGLTPEQTLKVLRAEGAAVSGYYSPPLHLTDAVDPLPPGSLPVAEALARRLVQLPVGELVSVEDVGLIGQLLRFLASHGAAVRDRFGRT